MTIKIDKKTVIAFIALITLIVAIRFDDIKSFLSRNVRDFNTEMQSPDSVKARQDFKNALSDLHDAITTKPEETHPTPSESHQPTSSIAVSPSP